MTSRPPIGHTGPAHTTPGDHIVMVGEPFVQHGLFASVDIARTRASGERRDTFASHDLHEAERAFAQSLAVPHREGFIAGRRALRAAVQQLAPGAPVAPLLRTDRGAPLLPHGLTGSISHKRDRAVALAAPSATGLVGIDLEERPLDADLARPSIAPRILTDIERARLAHLDALAHREATLVHFALKEAVYKAIDPLVQRYVRFTEVELHVHDDGTAHVRLFLPEPVLHGAQVLAHWRLEGRWIVAMAVSSATHAPIVR